MAKLTDTLSKCCIFINYQQVERIKAHHKEPFLEDFLSLRFFDDLI